MHKNLRWLGLYAFASFVELLGDITGDARLTYVSKPLLMPILGLWFYFETKAYRSYLRGAMLVGLAFATLGDTLLMLNGRPDGFPYFLAGLGAFLITQICYAAGFQSVVRITQGYLKQKPVFILPFIAYLVGLMALLWSGIPPEMKIPVALYGTILTTMAVSVFNLKEQVALDAFSMLFYGAFLFVLSDSMIAVAKFAYAFDDAHIGIMVTYIAGQWLLVSGAAVLVREV
ncbi:MAG: lysoplasmalogenase [Bacteroidota bacterium]